MGEFITKDRSDGCEYSAVIDDENTGTAGTAAKGKRSHRATGNPVGRPRKDGRPAGTAAPAAGNNQPKTGTEKGEANPVLINAQPPIVKKPVKGSSKKKKNDIDQVAGQIAFFTQGLFAMIAARSGEHWQVTEDEALNVAMPAARILDRLEISETVSKYSDYAALAVASGAIIIPRIISDQQIKQTRSARPGGVKLVRIDSQPTVSSDAQPSIREDGPTNLRQSAITDVIDQIIGG